MNNIEDVFNFAFEEKVDQKVYNEDFFTNNSIEIEKLTINKLSKL